MQPAPQKLHRLFAPWLALPLLVSLGTGIAYRLGRTWFGMDEETGDRILDLHAGGWLGDTGSIFYVLLTGFGLLGLTATGVYMVLKSRTKGQPRVFHRIVGAIFFLPLAVSAITGVGFKVGEEWFHFPDNILGLLMNIHQGSWLGKSARPLYVLVVGLGLLSLVATGLRMVATCRRKPKNKAG